MDQRLIAGLGNIYVCEALWRARISPDRTAGTLATRPASRRARPMRLAEAIREVLQAAINAGGSSLRDHIRADGELGDFQHDFAVYDREGEPCPRRRAASSAARSIPAARRSIVRSASARGVPVTMAHENIVVETRGRVGLIRLDRPKALNALSTPLIAELVAALGAFERDEAIGAIVITGSEKAFAAGADIKEMAALGFVEAFSREQAPRSTASRATRKPIVAAVAGYCLGGGCELALMCDIIIAADTAKFGQPEITLGIMPGMGGTQRLPRAIGKAKAMDLILTGRMMDAAEAERAGLVARVVPAAELLDEALSGRGQDRRRSRCRSS